VAGGIPQRAGLELPEQHLQLAVSVFWSIFIGSVFEGKFKGADYTGGFKRLLAGTRFRLGLVTVFGMLLNAGLEPFGAALPEETVTTLGNFILAAVLGIAGLDGFRASQK
jgi:hypothetical protein